MSINTNKTPNITMETVKTDTVKPQTTFYNSSYNYTSFNAYPSLKREHDFSAVLTEDFKKIIKMEQPQLKKHLYETLISNGYKPQFRDGFIYAKGEAPIMLVAHMDTVHKKPVKEIYVSDYGNITSPQGIGGDDRCGIYMITQLLKLKPYVLFTEDEEVGGVGAKKFAATYKKGDLGNTNVKYIIEFDRKGSNDMVFYECDNPEFTTYIAKFGWDERIGTYSDICDVAPAIGVSAVNLSSGYYKAHTTEEIINIDDVMTNLTRVRKMIKAASKDEVPTFKYIESLYAYHYDYSSKKDASLKTSESVTAKLDEINKTRTANAKNVNITEFKEIETKENKETESIKMTESKKTSLMIRFKNLIMGGNN